MKSRSLAGSLRGFLFFIPLLLAACGRPVEVDIPEIESPTPTKTAPVATPTEVPPPEMLIVCLAEEPSSLYLYDDLAPEAETILEAIYDGPIDMRSHQFQPVILASLPSLENGGARIEAVPVTAGDRYLNPRTHLPETLEADKPYFPSGCRADECIQNYDQGQVIMDQLVVEFELLPDLTWSDGVALTAQDSVFSYQLDAHEDTPTTKYLPLRTQDYRALDEIHTVWVGIPGFMDPEFAANFWSPLPEHIWGGMEVSDLLNAEESRFNPLGWGPYVMEAWEPGESIKMRRNENYFRAAEGLPRFELLLFRFLGTDTPSALEQVITSECDILDESLMTETRIEEALAPEQAAKLSMVSTPGTLMERIDFNVSSSGILGQASRFADIHTREAIAACIDREAIVEDLLAGLSAVPYSYLPPDHPLYLAREGTSGRDLDQANTLLQEVGWIDDDGDPETPRIAEGIPGIQTGTPFSFEMLFTPGPYREKLAQALKEDLAECGIDLRVAFKSPAQVLNPWPDGLVFGRQFEAVEWAWPILNSPPCEMFAGFEIPSESVLFGINATGFNDESYDQACQRILYGPPEGEDYREAVRLSQAIFQEKTPSLPLFMRPRVLIHSKKLCGLEPNASTLTALWNLEVIARGAQCTEE